MLEVPSVVPRCVRLVNVPPCVRLVNVPLPCRTVEPRSISRRGCVYRTASAPGNRHSETSAIKRTAAEYVAYVGGDRVRGLCRGRSCTWLM